MHLLIANFLCNCKHSLLSFIILFFSSIVHEHTRCHTHKHMQLLCRYIASTNQASGVECLFSRPAELILTHLRLLVLHHFLCYLVCICGETVDFNPPFVLETDIPKFLSIYNGYIYILWLKLMVIDWTEKLYMITISNQVEKFLPV